MSLCKFGLVCCGYYKSFGLSITTAVACTAVPVPVLYAYEIINRKNIASHSSIEHPDITLGSAHSYGLCIAEDDGEVDWAFPCLDAKEPCSKFGFTYLGLVDLKSIYTSDPDSLPDHGGIIDFPMVYSKHVDRQSHPNTSRQNTGGSGTSEAVFYAIQSVNNGETTLFLVM